jgi:hypothetical protein
MNAPIVEYQSYKKPPVRLTMESGTGFVRVIFPVGTLWVHVLSLTGTVAAAVVWTFVPFVLLADFRLMHGKAGALPTRFLWDLFWMNAPGSWLLASVFWIMGIFEWWKFRKWGRVPRILTASKEGLALTYLGWFGMREKCWPIGEIKKVELEPMKWNLNRRAAAFYLLVHRVKGWALRYQLSSRDREVPGQIATGIRAALGLGE